METLLDYLAQFGDTFLLPFQMTERVYWLYLVSALLIAIIAFGVSRHKAGKSTSLRAFLTYCFPRSVYLHRSAIVDYCYLFINRFLFALLVAPFIVGTGIYSSYLKTSLRPLFPEPFAVEPSFLFLLFYTLIITLAFDFALFFVHYVQHQNEFLWQFHKVHHSAEVLTPLTVYRFHPMDDLLNLSVVALFTGTTDAAFSLFFGPQSSMVGIVELNIFLFAFYLIGYNLRHSHIWVSYGTRLNKFFISPAQHQIHHSKAPRHYYKNFGFIFAFWDLLAGSLYNPKRPEALEFGLYDDEHREFNSVWNLYYLPFKKAFALFRPADKRIDQN